MMIVIFSVILSIEALIFIYTIFSTGSNKLWLLVPIYIVMVVISAIVTKEAAYFGLAGILGFIPLLMKWKSDKKE